MPTPFTLIIGQGLERTQLVSFAVLVFICKSVITQIGAGVSGFLPLITESTRIETGFSVKFGTVLVYESELVAAAAPLVP